MKPSSLGNPARSRGYKEKKEEEKGQNWRLEIPSLSMSEDNLNLLESVPRGVQGFREWQVEVLARHPAAPFRLKWPLGATPEFSR